MKLKQSNGRQTHRSLLESNKLKSKIVFLNQFTKILKIYDFDETLNIIDDIIFSGDRVYASTINNVRNDQGDVWSFTGDKEEEVNH